MNYTIYSRRRQRLNDDSLSPYKIVVIAGINIFCFVLEKYRMCHKRNL